MRNPFRELVHAYPEESEWTVETMPTLFHSFVFDLRYGVKIAVRNFFTILFELDK